MRMELGRDMLAAMSLYDSDFHAWAREQADAVRRRSLNELDWENVAEELESLGKQQRRELRNRYQVLLMHLLKLAYQSDRRTRSWDETVNEQRRAIREHLDENPSLRASNGELFRSAFQRAREMAAYETSLHESMFPVEPPFTPEQALDEQFWPGVEMQS